MNYSELRPAARVAAWMAQNLAERGRRRAAVLPDLVALGVSVSTIDRVAASDPRVVATYSKGQAYWRWDETRAK